MNKTKQFKLELRSDPDQVTELEPFVDQLKDAYGIKEELFGNILITLTEAVNNSIIHGNNSSPDKKVTVTAEKENNALTITVSDEGPGFDYNNLPDPTDPENLEKLTGRGVFLMNQLTDLLIYSEEGSTVELQFNV